MDALERFFAHPVVRQLIVVIVTTLLGHLVPERGGAPGRGISTPATRRRRW